MPRAWHESMFLDPLLPVNGNVSDAECQTHLDGAVMLLEGWNEGRRSTVGQVEERTNANARRGEGGRNRSI